MEEKSEKKIRLFAKSMYKIRLRIIKGAAPADIEIEEYVFRFGKFSKDYYIDYAKKNIDEAEDMKHIYTSFSPSGEKENDITKKRWWRLGLLWNKLDVISSMEDLLKNKGNYYIYKKKKQTIINVNYYSN